MLNRIILLIYILHSSFHTMNNKVRPSSDYFTCYNYAKLFVIKCCVILNVFFIFLYIFNHNDLVEEKEFLGLIDLL